VRNAVGVESSGSASSPTSKEFADFKEVADTALLRTLQSIQMFAQMRRPLDYI